VFALSARGIKVAAATAVAALALAGTATAAPSDKYVVSNLVSSDTALVPADRGDENLVNPWGLVSSPTSPWWAADQGKDVSTLVPATGAVNNLVVSVPGGPTGIVWNGAAGAFPVTGGQSAFIFATMGGGIYGWRTGSVAELALSRADVTAFYTGLALAATPTGQRLYAADFRNNRVDVIDAQWQLVSAPGSSADPNLPAGYAPFGIQTIGSRIFVTYGQHNPAGGNRELTGAGLGVVNAFDLDGNLLARVATGGVLNAPWGTAMADPNFGVFGGDLLIGNFGDGRINAFHENADGTWTPSGTLKDLDGAALVIPGLWAIQFGSGAANNGQRNHMYFTAGPLSETAGLLGRVIPNPADVSGSVPGTLALTVGTPTTFGVFTPGVARDYLATASANVLSTADNATLTVVDPSATDTGHLVNGAFSLPQALQASATSAAGTGSAFAPVGGSATPTTLLSYGGPVSNDPVTINFKQAIGATDPLRTGSYSKTLTFTLSTTTP
jgi:uncharacterized protein (TIGR03118 family)